MENTLLKQQLIDAARRIDRRNYQTNNGGNFSARCKEGLMVVKPTNVGFADVMPEDLVYADFDGKPVEKDRKPSKESTLHGVLYRKLPHIGAIMHCHSPWAVSFADRMEPLDFATYHAPLKLGSYVPVYDTESYAVTIEKAIMIAEELAGKYPDAKAFLLRKHGVVALGKNVADAVNIAELVEETATIALLNHMWRYPQK